MVRAVAWRNVRLRYKSSFLGFFWTLLNPLLFLMIFLLIFSEAFPNVENYPVFALSGLIFWSFFATSSAHIMGALVENAAVLRSLSVPPMVFPLAQLLAGLFNLFMSFIPFAIILHLFGREPHLTDLLVIPIVACFGGFIFGISLALSAAQRVLPRYRIALERSATGFLLHHTDRLSAGTDPRSHALDHRGESTLPLHRCLPGSALPWARCHRGKSVVR